LKNVISRIVNVSILIMETFNLDVNANVKDVYEIIAHEFDDKRQTTWDWIEEFLDQYPTGTLIYDIGCGPGRNIRPGMIGIDNCDNFLKICQQKNKDVMYGTMTELPVESDSGVGLICIAAFHHLKTQELRLKALGEFKRVLKKGSQMLISVWSIDQSCNKKLKFEYGDNLVPWTKPGKHTFMRYYYIFRDAEIRELFAKVDLEVVSHRWVHGNEIYILQTV
jgi:ubiquinone/menaquinone biosynthesis C-methylase UbiE